MARDFAQIRLSVWNDEGWTSLTLEEQAFYTMLSSQPTTNLAGVLDFLPGRLARLSSDLTPKRVRVLVESLEQRGMVFLDEDTEEILVRAVIRTSGSWKTPNSAQAIVTNIEQTMSRKLRSVLMYEVKRTLDEIPDEGKWEKSQDILRTVITTLDRAGINPWVKGYRNPLPGEGEGEGDGYIGDGEGDGAIRAARSDPAPAKPGGYPSDFEAFWSEYPKKADKRAAFKAWEKALSRATPEAIRDGAIRYREDPNREDPFTKNASTWLNADAWENEPLPARNVQQLPNRAQARWANNSAVVAQLAAEEDQPPFAQGALR